MGLSVGVLIPLASGPNHQKALLSGVPTLTALALRVVSGLGGR